MRKKIVSMTMEDQEYYGFTLSQLRTGNYTGAVQMVLNAKTNGASKDSSGNPVKDPNQDSRCDIFIMKLIAYSERNKLPKGVAIALDSSMMGKYAGILKDANIPYYAQGIDVKDGTECTKAFLAELAVRWGATGTLNGHSEDRRRLEDAYSKFVKPIISDLKEFKKNFKSHLNVNENMLDSYFVKTMINDFTKVVDSLESKLLEKMDVNVHVENILIEEMLEAFKYNLVVKHCIGEKFIPKKGSEISNTNGNVDDHDIEAAKAFVRFQLEKVLSALSREKKAEIVESGKKGEVEFLLEYEPRYAIGTGITPTKEMADDMVRFIRSELIKHLGSNVAQYIPVNYGGSASLKNIQSIAGSEFYSGGLVGTAGWLITNEIPDIVAMAKIKEELMVVARGYKNETLIQNLKKVLLNAVSSGELSKAKGIFLDCLKEFAGVEIKENGKGDYTMTFVDCKRYIEVGQEALKGISRGFDANIPCELVDIVDRLLKTSDDFLVR